MIQVITEVGSINKAADLLHMSQPTLSKKVSRLEQKINMELFNRDVNGMVPTEAARYLLAQGDNLKVQLHSIERQLELMANKVGGTVRIGVGPIIEQLILPKVLLDFAEQEHQFKLSVNTLPAAELLERLHSGHIDLAVGPFAVQDIPDEATSTLSLSEKLVVAVRAEHELSHQKNLTLSELVRFKIVAPDIPKSMGAEIQSFITHAQFEPDIVCENYVMAKLIVENSNYVTAGPESLFHKEFANGTLVKLTFNADIFWQCKCLAKPQTLLSPRVREVVDIFGQYMTS
jgi:DNA-binding transcriptional LysR family regulator